MNRSIRTVYKLRDDPGLAYLAREMRSPRKLPFITTLHGTDITLVGQELSFYAITKFSIEQSDAVTAVSAYLRDETQRAFAIQRPIRVIPNFVNLEEYRPADGDVRDGLAPAGHKILSHASNFREVKRVRDVVRIFARVPQGHARHAADDRRRP